MGRIRMEHDHEMRQDLQEHEDLFCFLWFL